MKHHLAFALALLVSLLVSLVLSAPIILGDCGASTAHEPALRACLDGRRTEYLIYLVSMAATFLWAIAEHVRRGRYVFWVLVALMLAPFTLTMAYAHLLEPDWQALDDRLPNA
ncbi:hypothetical protein [Sphingomonas sp.]|uniref:hypothetical protein n=1 Tax=Sphingomonas sp. TaxID=28214 RepID=UPI0025D1703B|nr:hypothetical protein [Sphingomonas sp.]